MISRLSSLLIFAVVGSVTLIASNPVEAQSSNKLSDRERAQALKIEAQSSIRRSAARIAAADLGIAKLAETPAGRVGKSVVVSIVPIGSTSTLARARSIAREGLITNRRAIVTRFDYATGITTRTAVDLNTDKTLSVRSDANYPTPLAAEEREEAIMLLRSAAPDVDKIARETDAEKVKFVYLMPINNDPAAPRYGHRLVYLWIAKPVQTKKYLIDLSSNQVVNAP